MSTAPSAVFWERVRELFHLASELPQRERAAMLARECAGDEKLRDEVESLLAAHDDTSEDFLARSVWELIDGAQGERLAGATIGPYRIVRQLGQGGMGTVFLAARDDDEQFAQRVAVKLVRGAESLVQRFRRERQILAALEHPNIARLLDGGTTADGLPYLVMEYVDGTPIDEYCRGLSLEKKLRLFLQLCDSVAYAHRALVIHRDIKPGNVLVTADGVPKLLDFGIAKLESQESDTAAPVTRLMTPEYASPEQLLAQPVTTASDVYSLGVLLFEILTGRKPFDTTRTPNTEAPDPCTHSRDVDTIVLAAMEVDPARRYGSVEKLADDVRAYLAGHPVSARRATFGYRASKFVRRNLLAVAAGAAIVIVTAIAFVATLHQKRIAERRFEQVRTLARSVVFEIHDAIAPLRGSTPARELLVRRALVYLDALAAEAENNTPLQIELAGAYLKIGDVQGLPYHANLGDTNGALRSYAKALSIAQSVAEREPENLDVLRLLADAHDHVGFVQQRLLRWFDANNEHEAARALRERIPRDAYGELALAKTYVALGDSRYIGHRQIPKPGGTARAAYEKALAILSLVPPHGPHRRDYLRELARAHQHLGGYLSGPNDTDLPRAIAHHNAALRALQERAALEPSDAAARRNVADQFVMRATAQVRHGDAKGALESCLQAQPVLQEIADADPKNVEAQHDLAFVHEQSGIAYTGLREFAKAERALNAAIAIRQRLVEDDPANREDLRGLVSLYSAMSDVHAARGDAAQAKAWATKSEKLSAEVTR